MFVVSGHVALFFHAVLPEKCGGLAHPNLKLGDRSPYPLSSNAYAASIIFAEGIQKLADTRDKCLSEF